MLQPEPYIIFSDEEDEDAYCYEKRYKDQDLPDVLSPNELQSLNLNADDDACRASFMVVDEQDQLICDDFHLFATKLGCQTGTRAKVISIVGKSGEGKSHLLNTLFFEATETFKTSSMPTTCTLGVWAAFQPCLQSVIIDTEGICSGGSRNEQLSMRRLLKIFAISDIVIIKTRCERLGSELFYLLGDASKAFNEHLSSDLSSKPTENERVGPSVIVCHETRFTKTIDSSLIRPAEAWMATQIAATNQDVSAFRRIRYVGIDGNNEEEDNSKLHQLEQVVREELESQVEGCRDIEQIFKDIETLCSRFNEPLLSTRESLADEYFTCPAYCTSCRKRCRRGINHSGSHAIDTDCVYDSGLENKVYLCRRCLDQGHNEIVVPKPYAKNENTWFGMASYAWSGYVLECSKCGVLYRSRQLWYGNQVPENNAVVVTQIVHMWPDQPPINGNHNAGQRLIDGVGQISSTLSTISSALPTRTLSKLAADQLAPDYWRPNNEIVCCYSCKRRFDASDSFHHCRACGEGFCESCSDYKRPVVERGWGSEPVRVCRECYRSYLRRGAPEQSGGVGGEEQQVQTRLYTERVMGTLSSFASSVLDYPMAVIKESARPDYWVPDEKIFECFVCHCNFDQAKLNRHHCRQCGNGVCDSCSKTRRPVPKRGWDQSVRICDACMA